MKTIYKPVWEGVLSSLRDIFSEGYRADKVIQKNMKANRKWGSSDRRLYAECVYDCVRWWRRLLWAMETKGEAYPLVVAAWCNLHEVEFGKGIEVPQCDWARMRERWDDASAPRAVRQSLPEWLDEWGFSQLGAKWDEVLPALNEEAPVFLRANRLKTTAEKLVARLASEGVEAEMVGGADGVRLKKRANVFITKAFKEGLFEVQDLNSQRIAAALEPKPGERVVDACAGAGGKSLHLAALMGNKGKVISLDTVDWKLGELRERSTRAGATVIETRLIDSTKVIKRLHDSADRLLLDVPCSGLGVLRRNPDAKWKLDRSEIDRLNQIQQDILFNYSAMVKRGGRMVYATCSVMPAENEAQVERFMKERGGEWRLLSCETLWPEAGGSDGFFVSVLERL